MLSYAVSLYVGVDSSSNLADNPGSSHGRLGHATMAGRGEPMSCVAVVA